MVPGQNWLSDNLAFVVGTLLGVLGIFVGLSTYWLSRRPKIVDYSVTASQDIVGASSGQLESKLLVSWVDPDDRVLQLKKPRVRTVRIKNTGKVEIDSEDFIEPVVVHVPDNESIVEASIIDMSHPGIHALGIIESNSTTEGSRLEDVACRPRLLNAGDWVDIQLVTDVQSRPSNSLERNGAQAGRVTVSSWVKGQSRNPRNYNEEFEPLLRSVLPALPRPARRTLKAIMLALVFILGATITSAMEDLPFLLALWLIVRTVIGAMILVAVTAAGMFLVALLFQAIRKVLIRTLQSYIDRKHARKKSSH